LLQAGGAHRIRAPKRHACVRAIRRIAKLSFLVLPRRDLRLIESLLRGFVRFVGVFHSLPGLFVAAQMILLVMMRGSGAMGVRRHLMKFRGT
jgi:hypothetical protein